MYRACWPNLDLLCSAFFSLMIECWNYDILYYYLSDFHLNEYEYLYLLYYLYFCYYCFLFYDEIMKRRYYFYIYYLNLYYLNLYYH